MSGQTPYPGCTSGLTSIGDIFVRPAALSLTSERPGNNNDDDDEGSSPPSVCKAEDRGGSTKLGGTVDVCLYVGTDTSRV